MIGTGHYRSLFGFGRAIMRTIISSVMRLGLGLPPVLSCATGIVRFRSLFAASCLYRAVRGRTFLKLSTMCSIGLR